MGNTVLIFFISMIAININRCGWMRVM